MELLGGSRVFRSVALGGFVLRAFLFAPSASAQSQVLVSYEDEMLRVIAMDGSTPIVEVNGSRVAVPDARMVVEKTESYTDGSIEVLEGNAILGQDYGSPYGGFFFRFMATVKSERDFEDCFILFVVTPETGENTILIREIPDLNTTGSEQILVTLPVNPGFGGGAFGYRVFSRGEEIRRYELSDPIALDEMGSHSSSVGGNSRQAAEDMSAVEPAKVLKARLLEFPESLVGKLSGGYASATYSIDQDGKAMEILLVASDNAEFVPEVWRTIVETRYEAGSFNGEKLVTTVKQNFFFNEFAPFAEGLEMMPYPKMDDRKATVIYAPMPKAAVSEPVTVRIELLVNKLGRVRSSRVLDGEGSEAGKASRLAVEKWIFLPAIVDGYPAEQTVTIPISFGIKE